MTVVKGVFLAILKAGFQCIGHGGVENEQEVCVCSRHGNIGRPERDRICRDANQRCGVTIWWRDLFLWRGGAFDHIRCPWLSQHRQWGFYYRFWTERTPT